MISSRQQLIDGALPHRKLYEKFMVSTGFRTESTKKKYGALLERYIEYLEEKRITKPDDEDPIAFLEYLKTTNGCHSATLQLYKVILRKFYKWTERRELYPNLGIELVSEPIERTYKRMELSVDEAQRLLSHMLGKSNKNINELRNYTMVCLILNNGFRTVEVARADIEDLKTEGDATYLYVQRKGHKDKDSCVRLVPDVLDVLNNYIKARKGKSGALFINHGNRKINGRVSTTMISRIVKENLKEIGIVGKEFTAHSLRHTFATLALANGASLEEVQDALGHKSINTTMIYVHTVNKRNNRSMSLVHAALSRREAIKEKKE